MTFYVIGSEADALGGAASEYDNVDGFDSDYSRASAKILWPEGKAVSVPTAFGSGTAAGFWVHARYVYSGLVGNLSNHDWPVLSVVSDTGYMDCKLQTTNGSLYVSKYQRNSTSVTNGTYAGYAVSQGAVLIDLHTYQSGADSVTEVYINSALLHKVTRTSETSNGISTVIFSSSYPNQTAYVSEVIIADTDTRGLRVKTVPMTGNSATNTAWNGDYTDIDEYDIDGNAISSDTLDDVETFTHAGVGSSLQAGGIAAVSVNGLMSGNGVNDIQACVRKSSTNYFSSDIGVNEALRPYSTIFTADPATSGSWGRADITGFEFGVKSVT